MPLFSGLIIPNGASLQAIDNNGVLGKAMYIDSFNQLGFQTPASDIVTFYDHNGGVLLAVQTESQGGLQLGPGLLVNATDASFNISPILGIDGSGNTIVEAFTVNNQVNLVDKSGNVIASFAGTNKIATLNGGQIVERTAVSANYTVLASDYIVAYTSTSSAFTATLPAAAAGNTGQVWIVKDESGAAATHNITVKTGGGTIDGVAAGTGKVINTNYGVLRVYSNGTNYFTF